MSILPQSRYAQGTVTRVADRNGIFQMTVFRTVPTNISKFTLYVWGSTDRPDVVANKVMGNPKLWWAIFDINPEIIYPLNVPAGTVIRVPAAPVAGQGTLLQ